MPDTKKIVVNDGSIGQEKCPKCGATDISLNPNNGRLRCNFCRFEFEAEKTDGWVEDLTTLEGEVIGEGSKDIVEDDNTLMTLKCPTCGAEVVIDTNEVTQARCHWCRQTLSINMQIPNGAVPDMVLPFRMKKDEARSRIEQFVGERRFFANRQFSQEFSTHNIMGVYLPYMIVDVNAHAQYDGRGEIETAKRRIKVSKDTYVTEYDADVYHVNRDFNIVVDGLTVESSADKLDKNSYKTNNILNSIMPFDTENCVKWDANYIRGYSSEKRDVNIDDLKNKVILQTQDIARNSAYQTLGKYNRGVRWDYENVDIKGTQWKTAYLPVWIYSYYEQKTGEGILHYVAVNARTAETMGSVPISMSRLFLVSAIIEVLCLIVKLFVLDNLTDSPITWLIMILGILFFTSKYSKYRNTGVRHSHEAETRRQTSDMKGQDQLVDRRRGTRDSRISGENSYRING